MPCSRCNGSGIDPEYSHAGNMQGDPPEPPFLVPCIECPFESLGTPETCHCGAVPFTGCHRDACGWTGPADCKWDHRGGVCFGKEVEK